MSRGKRDAVFAIVLCGILAGIFIGGMCWALAEAPEAEVGKNAEDEYSGTIDASVCDDLGSLVLTDDDWVTVISSPQYDSNDLRVDVYFPAGEWDADGVTVGRMRCSLGSYVVVVMPELSLRGIGQAYQMLERGEFTDFGL